MRTTLLLTGLTLGTVLLMTSQLAAERVPAHSAPSITPAPAPVTTTTTTKRVYASSADLPDGPEFPVRGTGTWHVVPGSAGESGQPYTVEVEDGVTVDETSFAEFVHATLTDPRGWGRPVRRVSSGPASFRVRLTSQETARMLCGFEIPVDVSCRTGGIVNLSAARWFRGAVAFGDDLPNYRRYVVNHEVGHAFGEGHRPCAMSGGPAPVMMQQTFSTSNDEVARITGGDPAIPANGKVCAPNPWPHP
jgi:hypothetical protein